MKNIMYILERVCVKNADEFYKMVNEALESQKKKFIVTANPEIVMMGKKSDTMFQILSNSEVEIIPDGIGLVKSLRWIFKNKEIQRNTGIDFVEYLLETANQNRKAVFIYGTKEEVLQDFLKMCRQRYPNIQFVGCYNGYSYSEDDVLEILKTIHADIYFAALGTPRQEQFLNKFYSTKQKGIFVGIGGSLDVLSGNSRRAPKFFLKHNIEWLYRITKEPKRIKRFLNNNVCYIFAFWGDYLRWNSYKKRIKEMDYEEK